MELDKRKILTIAVVFSIIGISALYALTDRNSTRTLELSEINEDFLGSRVKTEGFISDISWLGYTVVFEVKEKGVEDSLTVATDRQILEEVGLKEKMIPGARVGLEGKLEEYEDEVQLKIDNTGEISIEEETYSSFTSIEHILENPSWYEGMEVKIRGDIKKIEESDQNLNLLISDLEEDKYIITCKVDQEINEAEGELLGKPVVIEGKITYDSTTGTWMIRTSNEVKFK